VDEAAFAALMAAFSPFESRPALAVAVSGGSDSLGLCLLADRWARQRGGDVVALTVDHRLRPGSADEAGRVGAWLAGRGIRHEILVWCGDKPRSGIPAAARTARYALLEGWCRRAGVLHLLLGHTADDQVETIFLRLGRATGVEGAAGMSAVVERDAVRLLRPCLGLGRDRLRATLAAAGQDWIDDPTNADVRFARPRARLALTDLDAGSRAALARIGRDLGQVRLALEAATAAALAAGVRLHPAGHAVFDAAVWRRLPERLAVAVLGRLCTAIGGRSVPPRDTVVRAAVGALRGEGTPSATLAGCRLRLRGAGLLVCRESRRLPAPLVLQPGLDSRWDGRFRVAVARGAGAAPPRLDYLGRAGWAEVAAAAPWLAAKLPAAARPVTPAVWDDSGVLQVPHLAYTRKNAGNGTAGVAGPTAPWSIVFAPALSLSGSGFRLAPAPADTI